MYKGIAYNIESLICMYIYTAYHVSCRSDQFHLGTQQDSHEVLRLTAVEQTSVWRNRGEMLILFASYKLSR